MSDLTEEQMDLEMSKAKKYVDSLKKEPEKPDDFGLFSGMASMATGMNPAYFASGGTPQSATQPAPKQEEQKQEPLAYTQSEEEKRMDAEMQKSADFVKKTTPEGQRAAQIEGSEFPRIDTVKHWAEEGIGSLAEAISFDEPKPVESDLAQHLHSFHPDNIPAEVREQAKKETDPEKLKQFPEWFPKTNEQHRAVFDQKHADTTLTEDAKHAYNLAVKMGKGFGDMVASFGAGAAKLPAMFLEGPGTYGDITSLDEWKRWGNNLARIATVPGSTTLESVESVAQTAQNALLNGLSATDWLEQKVGAITHDEAFDRYLRRKRIDEYYAKWKTTDPNVFTRVFMEDPYGREVVENLFYSVASTFSPSVEDRLWRHNGDREAALREKQIDDLKEAQETLASFRKDASKQVVDRDITEMASFTPIGMNPFDIYGKAVGSALAAAQKARRLAQVAGKSGEEIAAMDSAAAQKAFESELKAAKDAQTPGWAEEGAGKLQTAIDNTTTRIAGALEDIPSPVKAGISGIGGGIIGATQNEESPISGFMKGAGIGLGGYYGSSAMKKVGSAALQAPGIAQSILAGRRMAGGAGKNVSGITSGIERAEEIGMNPKIAKFLADKGIPAARALDWAAENALSMARGSVHGATLAAAVGVLESKDPEQVADMMGQGVFFHMSGHILGNLAGVTHDRYESDLKRKRATAAKFVESLDPETRGHIDKLTNWETYVAAVRNLRDEAAQSAANAEVEHYKVLDSSPTPQKAEKSAEELAYAKRILNIREAQLRNAERAGVETARMYGDQVRIGLADLMNAINGSMTPGKNVELKIQTKNQFIEDALHFNRNQMLTDFEKAELIHQVAIRAGQLASIEQKGGRITLSTGKTVTLGDPNKSRIGVSIENVQERLLAGESVLSAVAHEVGHAFFDTKEFRENNAEVINRLFGTQKFDERGNLIAGEPGLYSQDDLVQRFKNYYANGAIGGWEAVAEAAGLLDPTTKDLDPVKTAKYMRDEVMAELVRGSTMGGITLGDSPKPWLAPLVDWLTVKDRNSKTKRAIREHFGLKGEKPWESELLGIGFSGEDIDATRKALRAVSELRGDVSAAEIIPHKPITETEIRANEAVAEQFKDALFATEKVVSVVDKEGNPLTEQSTGKPLPEIPLTDQNTFEGTWEHGENDRGESAFNQTSGYGEFPAEVSEKLGHVTVPPGGKIVIKTRIKRDASGRLQMLRPDEIAALNRARGNIVRKAMEEASDREYPGRLSAQSADGLSFGGVLSPEQIKNLKRLPETIIPFALKKRILEFNQLLINDQGEGMVGLYGQAVDAKGKYRSFAPKIVDFVPMGLKLSKDGNFLFTLFTKSGMREKLRRWEKDAPDLLRLWGGNTEAFMVDLKKVLENWKPTPENPKGRPGETGLDADPSIAISKKNRINDFLNMFRKTEDASLLANPDRTRLKRPARRKTKAEKQDEVESDPNTLVRSYRVDRFHDLAVSSDDPLRVNYGKAVYNLMPFKPGEEETRRFQLNINPSILRGLGAINVSYTAPKAQDALPGTDNRRNVGVKFMPNKEEEYRGVHRAPGAENGAPMHEVTKGIYPDDFYTLDRKTALQYYGSGDERSDAESMAAIMAAKGNPDARVKIYRAVPKYAEVVDPQKAKDAEADVKRYSKLVMLNPRSEWFREQLDRALELQPKKINTINPGDWVTPSRSYAIDHGESALRGEYRIIQKTVPASHLYTEGNSLSEFGYNPTKAQKKQVEPGIRFMPASLEIREGGSKQELEFWNREIENSGIKNKPTSLEALEEFITSHLKDRHKAGYMKGGVFPTPKIEKIKAHYQKVRDASAEEAVNFPEDWLHLRRMPQAQFDAQFTQDRVDEITRARATELARTASYLLREMGPSSEVGGEAGDEANYQYQYSPQEVAAILNSARRIRVNAKRNEAGELVPVIQKITDSNEAMPNEISAETATIIARKMRYLIGENMDEIHGYYRTAPNIAHAREVEKAMREVGVEDIEVRPPTLSSDEAFAQGVWETLQQQAEKRTGETGWKVYKQSDSMKEAEKLNADLAGTGWCTGGSVGTAHSHLRGGDFHVYFENGDPQIAIRTNNGSVAEVRGRTLGTQDFTRPELNEIAGDYISDSSMPGGQAFLYDRGFRKTAVDYTRTKSLSDKSAKYFGSDWRNYGRVRTEPEHSYSDTFEPEYLNPLLDIYKYDEMPEGGVEYDNSFGRRITSKDSEERQFKFSDLSKVSREEFVEKLSQVDLPEFQQTLRSILVGTILQGAEDGVHNPYISFEKDTAKEFRDGVTFAKAQPLVNKSFKDLVQTLAGIPSSDPILKQGETLIRLYEVGNNEEWPGYNFIVLDRPYATADGMTHFKTLEEAQERVKDLLAFKRAELAYEANATIKIPSKYTKEALESLLSELDKDEDEVRDFMGMSHEGVIHGYRVPHPHSAFAEQMSAYELPEFSNTQKSGTDRTEAIMQSLPPEERSVRFMPASLEIREEGSTQELEFWNRVLENSGIKEKPTSIEALQKFIFENVKEQHERGYREVFPTPNPSKIKAYYQRAIRDVTPEQAAEFPENWLQIRRMPQDQFDAQFTQNRVNEITRARATELTRLADYLLSEMHPNYGYGPQMVAAILNSARKFRVNVRENESRELVPVIQKITDSNEAMPNEISGATAAAIADRMTWKVVSPENENIVYYSTRNKNLAEGYAVNQQAKLIPPMNSDDAFVAGILETYQRLGRRKENKTGWEVYKQSDHMADAEILNSDLAGTNWCTGGSVGTAHSHLRGGDFHVYYENGDPKLAIRTNDGVIAEIRGRGKSQNIDSPGLDSVAEKYLADSSSLSGGEDYLHDVKFRKVSGIFNRTGALPEYASQYFLEDGTLNPKPRHSYASEFDTEYTFPLYKIMRMSDGGFVQVENDAVSKASLWLLDKIAHQVASTEGMENYIHPDDVKLLESSIGDKSRFHSIANEISTNIHQEALRIKDRKLKVKNYFEDYYSLSEAQQKEVDERALEINDERGLNNAASDILEAFLHTSPIALEQDPIAAYDSFLQGVSKYALAQGWWDTTSSSKKGRSMLMNQILRKEFYKERDAVLRANGAIPIRTLSDAELQSSRKESGTRFMPAKLDAEHAAAHKEKDEKKARRLVEEAARSAGFSTEVFYHGTPTGGFSEFDPELKGTMGGHARGGFSFTTDKSAAESYSKGFSDDMVALTKAVSTINRVFRKLDADPEALRIIGEREYNDTEIDVAPEYGAEHFDDPPDRIHEWMLEQAKHYKKKLPELSAAFSTAAKELKSESASPEVKSVYLMLPEGVEEIDSSRQSLANDVWGLDVRSKPHGAFIVNLDEGDRIAYVANPESIKSADPFTYDSQGNLIPLSERFNTGSKDIRFMPSKAEKEQDELVRKSAEKAGYTVRAFHGTPKGEFNEFTSSDKGLFFTDKKPIAEGYTRHRGLWLSESKTPYVAEVFLKTETPLEIDADGARNNNIPFPGIDFKKTVFGNLPQGAVSVSEAARMAFEQGYDSLIVKNVRDAASKDDSRKSTVYAVKSPEQVKSAKSFTTDDSGNEIPISDRFNSDLSDIRFMPNKEQVDQAAEERGYKGVVRSFPKQEYKSPIKEGDWVSADNQPGKDYQEEYAGAGWDKPETTERAYVSKGHLEDMETGWAKGQTLVVQPGASIKSPDVVTYDDAGNPIPLSERFNASNPDPRFMPRKLNEEPELGTRFMANINPDYDVIAAPGDDVIKLASKIKTPKNQGYYAIGVMGQAGNEVVFKWNPNDNIAPPIRSIWDLDGHTVHVLQADRHHTLGTAQGGGMHPFQHNTQITAKAPDGTEYVIQWANIGLSQITGAKRVIKNSTDGFALVTAMEWDAHQSNRDFGIEYAKLIDGAVASKSLSGKYLDLAKVLYSVGQYREAERAENSRRNQRNLLLKKQGKPELPQRKRTKEEEMLHKEIGLFGKSVSTAKSAATRGDQKAAMGMNDKTISEFSKKPWYKKAIAKFDKSNATFSARVTALTFNERKSIINALGSSGAIPSLSKALHDSGDFYGANVGDVIAAVQLSKNPDAFAVYFGTDPEMEAKMSKTERSLRDQFIKKGYKQHKSYDWMMLGPKGAKSFIVSDPVEVNVVAPDYAASIPNVRALIGKKAPEEVASSARGAMIAGSKDAPVVVRMPKKGSKSSAKSGKTPAKASTPKKAKP